MTERSDLHLLSGAYALHSVTGEEAAEVEAAMATSEELRDEVAELADTAVLLGLSVEPEAPPPALRARLLDLIEDTPQVPPAALRPAAAALAESAPRLPSGEHVARSRRRQAPRAALLLTLAAAAVLLFGGGLLVDRFVLGPGVSQSTEFARLTAAPDVRRSEAPVAGGGTATVYWSKRLDESAVVLNGVAEPRDGSLQIWRVVGGTTMIDAGLYTPVGSAPYRLVKGALAPRQAFAVTVEPPGGSRQPTTKPIVVVPNA
jgi:anti-sigma-K factor RskA